MIDLIRSTQEDEFAYSTAPKNFANTIMMVFDRALEELQKMPDIEPKLMTEVFKGSRSEVFVKVPIKNTQQDNLTNEQLVWDENAWVTELYHNLKEALAESLDSLELYLQ